MVPQWIIEKKRDGLELSEQEIRSLIEQYSRNDLPDYQMAAFAMAVYFRGMTARELAVLTDAMMRSGDLMNLSDLPGVKADKHSTGGIGDKVSLILAPLMAACGLTVPMISGRGLGITGGTLDKLESIPGYRVNLSTSEFRRVLIKCGLSLIGQTERLAPADRKLYALRDVTGTVPSIPLISASIMSKKLAEGADVLVLDVKWGSGAFMKTVSDACKLAETMIAIGRRMGRKVSAIVTDMNQPLGRTAGNAVEMQEVIECLNGGGDRDLMNVTFALGSEMLSLAGKVKSPAAAMQRMEQALADGTALRKLKQMVELHGGDVRVLDDPGRLVVGKYERIIKARTSGWVQKADAGLLGRACLLLGAGRRSVTDKVDHSAGLTGIRKIGERVNKGETLVVMHAADKKLLRSAGELALEAFRIAKSRHSAPQLIVRRLG
jgi:pyrimidine-nucleoside phosphorylase